ncbi:citramalate synthase [Crassaminicella profunda]|uniref:citramalate synthase n=1 Tax=Crassaminicella profunda TaxID=1286698 RepID=UPI001CA7577C|nr:citramalate synthase [Crassaminicella profunda]QZY53946.1 citramalate synthase [Crassaminicella profunda]
MANKVKIFDSTLRDGAQGGGVSFSVEDKIKIVKALDDLGISYIEAGNPGSNFKDLEFFKKVTEIDLKNSKLVAFGSTRRKGVKVSEDENVKSLLTANTEVVAIFGKSWDFHVTEIIKTSLEENLKMIKETIQFFKSEEKEVVFDAEHFFDGYKENPSYAFEVLRAAVDGGADSLVLCDTNGGTFPNEIYEVTKKVVETFPVEVGIHCHNDCGMAVANSVMAVEAGAVQIQGTFIGIGERCGNANLSTLIPNIQMKNGLYCIPNENLEKLTTSARYVAEITNIQLDSSMPYVGNSAFAHKGGMHIDGVNKASHSFEHMNPEFVGNRRRFLMSEVSGKTTILPLIQKIDKNMTKSSPKTQEIMDKLKRLEHKGYQFEGAESAFELIIRKHLGKYKPFFELKYYKVIEEEPANNRECSSSALIKVMVDGKEEMTATEGNGPVNALDKALRKALEVFYPNLKEVHLSDYKVRVLNAEDATAAKVRVLIESTDGKEVWSMVGVSTNIIEASMIALIDSIEYKLIKDLEKEEE